MSKKTPTKPSKFEIGRSWFHVCVCGIMWILLGVAAVNLFLYYSYLLLNKGFYDKETVRIAIYIIVGSFFFLVIYKKDVENIFKVKMFQIKNDKINNRRRN